VSGSSLLTPDDLSAIFAPHTGTNVSLDEIVKTAGDLHQEFRRLGYPLMSVAISPDQITNGIVTLNVFQTAVPQVVVSGQSRLSFPEDATLAAAKTAAPPVTTPINTNPPVKLMAGPATPAQVAQERESLRLKMEELAAQEKDHRVHVVPTPGTTNVLTINQYLVDGNTILSPAEIGVTLTNVDGAFGTNVTFDGIRTAVTELQKAYQERGYVTVAVGLPPQKLTNATIKVHVTEGRLVAINVTGNQYFSSNNVMRALPSLHTNMLLNGPIFQSEVNRANANQDRQIYPVIGPGPEVGTSALTLKVKDHLPVHGKIDLDDQSSPGTPLLRVNASAVVDNLWQMEHQLGVQYGFSPEAFKQGSVWDWYDQPLVANYSAFYRMPLGNPEAIEDTINAKPGAFGYDEATRRFNLPPPSGRPELTCTPAGQRLIPGWKCFQTTLFTMFPACEPSPRRTINKI
jgi:hemolysin activation/secretion protein